MCSEIVNWLKSLNHALCRLQKEVNFILFFKFNRILEGLIELRPLFWMSLSNMALEVCSLLVFFGAEHMWALVQALAFMSQLVSYQFDLIPELLAANVTGQFALGIAIEPVFAIL